VIITPERYSTSSPYELLTAAAKAHLTIDHRVLHAIVDQPDTAIPDILRFVGEDRGEDSVDLEEDLILIAHYLRDERLIPYLVECVGIFHDDVPDELVEAVCGFREAAMEPLLSLYESLPDKSDSEVPFLLAALGVKDERIDAVIQTLAETDPEDHQFCSEVYTEVSRATRELEPYDIWSDYAEEAAPPFDVLTPDDRMDFFESDSAEIRALAVGSFYNEPDVPQHVLDSLRQIARFDADAEVRASGWRALALEVEDDDLQVEMRNRLQAASTPLRERAGLVVALAPEADQPEVRKRVMEVFEPAETRASAVEAMWRSADRSYTAQVKQALDDPDDAVREQAAIGVGYLGMVGELGQLKAMFDDPDLRPAALMGYSLAMPEKNTAAHLRSLLKKIENLANGFSPEEADIVRLALDQRLAAAGQEPVFGIEG
jgi:hypothetical protein